MADILVTGYSVRAMARSALAAGLEVATIDAFGDRDLLEPLPQPVSHHTLAPFDTVHLAAIAPVTTCVAWTSNLENAPAALHALAHGRTMIGNGALAVERVRQPEGVAEVLEAHGLPTARVVSTELAGAAGGQSFVRKPRAGGGGHGVQRWHAGSGVGASNYLQEEVRGVAGSLLFLADGHDAVPIAVTRQLIGEADFGARGYAWCGNLVGAGVLPAQDDLAASACAAAVALTGEFGLRGLNGIDFIARNGEAVVIEVNPRWTGATELVERATGAFLFPAHADASAGELSVTRPPASRVFGKAVVYARAEWTAGDTDRWLADGDIRDIPASSSVIPMGAPICTVFAESDDADGCLVALRRKAVEVQPA